MSIRELYVPDAVASYRNDGGSEILALNYLRKQSPHFAGLEKSELLLSTARARLIFIDDRMARCFCIATCTLGFRKDGGLDLTPSVKSSGILLHHKVSRSL